MIAAEEKVNDHTAGIEKGLQVTGPLSFTGNDKYVLFNLTLPKDTSKPRPDAVQVDVWSYKDSVLQSVQAKESRALKIYKAIYNPIEKKVLQQEMSMKS